MKIHLCTPYFRSSDKERQAEFDECLKGNLDNPYIDRVTVFIDDGVEPPFRHAKLRIVEIPGRLTYKDWLDFALEEPEPHISVLGNTDILFDETVSRLGAVFSRGNRFVALSRHERIGDALQPHPDPKWSQDVWAVRSDDAIGEAFRRAVDFPLGVPRCDNKIVYEAAIHGFDLINPFPAVRAIHLHESQVRGYHKTQDRTLIGGMGYARPQSDLSGDSVVELSIWPLKAENIAHVEVMKALEVWKRDDADAVARSSGVVAYDRDWQFPAITEKRAYENLTARKELIPSDCRYLAFPWATLIDKLINRPSEGAALLTQLGKLRPGVVGKRKVATVCQHIHLLKFQKNFANAGVTDIFWSHKVEGQDVLPEFPHIRLHPFPLYPVQCADEFILEDENERRLLFSFVGAKARNFYLTQVRTYILEELSRHRRGLVVSRENWHYNKVVYDHQILKSANNVEKLVDDAASAEFVRGLRDSVFSLCPSGSGPNSIRLWESIAAGAIPVILADTIELPGDPKLWEQAVVFCKETREDVKALPKRLEALAQDQQALAQMRQALRQLWALYNPNRFTYDIECFFASQADAFADGAYKGLPLSTADLLEIAKKIPQGKTKPSDDEYFLLWTCASRVLLDIEAFASAYARHEALRMALDAAGKRCAGSESAEAWSRAYPALAAHLGLSGKRGGRRPLNVFLTGRNANRSPLAYAPYRRAFASRLDFADGFEHADLLVVAASANISEHYAQALKGRPHPHRDKLVVLSEEPLWDTTWGLEFDKPQGHVRFWKYDFDYAVLNHLTTDIFKFDKIPYFVTTDDRYAIRYANLFRRNAALTPQEVLDAWRRAPIRQAYFAEKRSGERYEFARPEHDLYGYCGFRTRLAEAAPKEGVVRVGQGWSETARRQGLPDWHLDKLATLDRRTFIASALENTHLPDYITEKPFDAFAVLAVPAYAASPAHRIHELAPEGSFINVFGLEAEEAAERLRSFEPDLDFAARYLDAQNRLAKLFGNIETMWAERQRVVDATLDAFEAVHRGDFAGLRASSPSGVSLRA